MRQHPEGTEGELEHQGIKKGVRCLTQWLSKGLAVSIFLAFLLLIAYGLSPLCPELAFESSVSNTAPFRDSRITIDNPYTGGIPFKGQLHAHTTNSDGSLSPVELATLYKDSGYHFLAITDHGHLTQNPNVPGIIHLNGMEMKTNEGHIMVYGVRSRIWHSEWSMVSDDRAQRTINTVADSRGLSGLAHPNAPAVLWTNEEIGSLSGFAFIEVCNGDSEAEDKWDYALSNTSLRKVWGTAVDDFHRLEHLNKGWVVVYAHELSVCSILCSLSMGNFYATQGPDMNISVSDTTITIAVSDPSSITWKGCNGIIRSDKGKMLSTYKPDGTEKYIRVVIIRDSDGKKAWSQPLFTHK